MSDDVRSKAEQRAIEAERQAQQPSRLERRLADLKEQREEAEISSIANALHARKIQSENTTRAYYDAQSRGDAAGMEEASRRLDQLGQDISELESGLTEYEKIKAEEAAPRQQHQQPVTSFRDAEHAIANLPNLMESERQFLREHPDAVRNPTSLQRLQVAYLDAERQGIERGSQRYFDLISDRLGYARKTREPGNETITLTKEQRDAARISGISDSDYVRGVQRLAAMRRDGFYH